jgi:hypothetical protein
VSRYELRESSMAWCARRSMSCGRRIGLPVLCGAAPLADFRVAEVSAPGRPPRRGVGASLFGNVCRSHDRRPKARNRKAKRDGKCRSKLSPLR